MQTKVLLSIKPEFAEAIFAGTKKYEFRRAIFRDPDVKQVLVYVSSPISKVLGEFEVEGVLDLSVKELWNKTSSWAGIDKTYFRDYFKGKKKGYALKVKKPKKYVEPLSLQADFGISHPPQSFRYIQAVF